jgi:hypothetical protein
VSTKAILHEHKIEIAYTNMNIIDAHAKFAMKWQLLIGTPTHELPTEDKHDHFPL